MRALLIAIAVPLLALPGAPASAGEPASGPASAGQVILDETSYWRCHSTWRTPLVRKDKDQAPAEPQDRNALSCFAMRTDPSPAEWVQPDFPDRCWLTWRVGKQRPRELDYGFKRFGACGPILALQCLRGKFLVDDPTKAQGLTLSVSYRGGVVVYVNGQEVARASLPKGGPITPETLADDYPPECFLHPGPAEHGSNNILAEFGQPGRFRDLLEKRIRRIESVSIDPKLLRKGVNVLAVESHRAPYYGNGLEKEGGNHESVWSTGGLVSIELRAASGVEPNLARPKGLQVWNASVLARLTPLEHGDPLEPLGAVVIPAARNGTFTGKVAVTSDGPIRGLKAEASELALKGGAGKIPASAVKILYTVRDDRMATYTLQWPGFWDTLVETPPAEIVPEKEKQQGALLPAFLPVWVKVRVPADAAPGEYEGKLTISTADGKPVEVPVRLKVADWQLPDSKDFTGHLSLVQSTDTLAMQYKVPPWSEEHWKLIEESFKLMGEVGNKYVFIPMICRTNFGNEQSLVRWVKDGAGYKYDFSNLDRYLDLAQKHTRPDVICLYVWDRYAGAYSVPGNRNMFTGQGALVTLYDPATGKSEDLEGPKLGTPEGKAFWEPVYKEVRARLEKRGLFNVTYMGMNGDAYRPTEAIFAMFREVMPGTMWISNSHAQCRGEKIGGIPVGYNTAVYINFIPPPTWLSWDEKRAIGWRLERKTDIFMRYTSTPTNRRLTPTQHLGVYRLAVESVFFANCSGLGRSGFDLWPVLGRDAVRSGQWDKHSTTLGARYVDSCWAQLNMDRAMESLVAPGPKGAIPTERFENLREGLQEAEARVFIEKALIAPAARGKLGEDLAKKFQTLLDDRQWRIRGAFLTGAGFEFAEAEPFREELYAAAAEVADKLGVK